MLRLSKVYVWQGVDLTGRRVRGRLMTDSLVALRTQLQLQGILLTQTTLKWQLLSTRYAIKPLDILEFSRQLSSLLIAGLPIREAFDLLVQQCANQPDLQRLLAVVKGAL